MSDGPDVSTGEERRACVIGWPITHSRSPLIHGHWLRTLGIRGSYEKVAVQPDAAAAFLRNLAQHGYDGCNVTLPLKEIAFATADERLPEAEAVGAANTLWLDDGRLIATNTDTYGFMTHLSLSAPGWDRIDRPALVLGAGGAARAIVHGFLQAGMPRVFLANRTHARAEALAVYFGGGRHAGKVVCVDWAERGRASSEAGVIVNTTTIGMRGKGDLGLDLTAVPDEAVVADIVYVPLETGLLAAARARGLRTVDGLGMLLHQAVPGFERWFGVRPQVTAELRQLVAADVEAHA